MTDGPRSPAGVAARVREVVAERVSEVRIRNGEVVVRAPATGVADLLRALAGDERLTLSALADLTAVDHVFGPDRFELVYQLLSPESGHRVRVSVPVGEGRRSAESVTAVHAVADWLEREVFEQFGIRFEGHPDLRRILLEADANPHPLRKDAIGARPGRAARSVG